ncbi:MAG: exosortase H [Acidobacteria bacterium]|nr:exosortase H [Acidobacteriota bacterium]
MPRQRRSGKFLLAFVLSALCMFALLLAPPMRPLVEGFSGNLAFAAGWLIRACGGACLQQAAFLSNPARGFTMEVRDGCNGANVVILLWAAMLAYPTGRRWKAVGLGAGLAAIMPLNLLRLITLFYLGQYHPSVFEFAHLYLWEMLIIMDAMAVFALWVRRAEAR